MSIDVFRWDLVRTATFREAARIYEAEHLTHLEQETFCRALQIVGQLAIDAMEKPGGNAGFHLSDAAHSRLREALRVVEEERQIAQRKRFGGYLFAVLCSKRTKPARVG